MLSNSMINVITSCDESFRKLTNNIHVRVVQQFCSRLYAALSQPPLSVCTYHFLPDVGFQVRVKYWGKFDRVESLPLYVFIS